MSNLESLQNTTITMGQLFASGAAFDQVRGDNLVFVTDCGRPEGPASVFSYEGITYAGVKLSDDLQRALRLPAHAEDPGSLGALLASVVKLFISYGTEPDASLSLAYFALATWFSDCTPSVPVLNFWGPAGAECTLLELLSCLCRRPLRMLQPSFRELAKLPPDLTPTLILQNPKPNALGELLAAASGSGVGIFHGGEFPRLRCAVIVCSAEPISCAALDVPLLTSATAYRRITSSEAAAISESFQPRLLGYRLRHHVLVRQSQFDCPDYGPTTRLLARTYGATLEGDPDTQSQMLALLAGSCEQEKTQSSQGESAAVLEGLMTTCHEAKTWAYTQDIAALANAALAARGERGDLKPRAVGEIMRSKLGFTSMRSAGGYRLKITTAVCSQVHHLAAVFGVLPMHSDCELCQREVSNANGGSEGEE